MASMTWVCVCGTAYPDTVTVCEIDGQHRPEPPLVTPDQGSEPVAAHPAPAESAVEVQCPGCGRPNPATATQCLRCGDPLPTKAPAVAARLVLPGQVVAHIPFDQRILLGRKAIDPVIRAALESHDQVSREHAEITVTGTTARIKDLKSTNGTFVNGVRVESVTTIPIGEGLRLRFGQELELFLLPGETHE